MDEDTHEVEDEDYQIMRWTFTHDLVEQLNMKNNCSMKDIKNPGMSCISLWIPMFVVLI